MVSDVRDRGPLRFQQEHKIRIEHERVARGSLPLRIRSKKGADHRLPREAGLPILSLLKAEDETCVDPSIREGILVS
jgi:hypothetical protein